MSASCVWELTHFQPISFCNTFSLHLPDQGRCPFVIDINGSLHWADWAGKNNAGISLKQCLEGTERDTADFDLELVTSDSLLFPSKGTAKYSFDGCIGTCWVLYDHLFAVERQFAVLFLILPDFRIKMAAKFPLQSVPTFSKLHLVNNGQRLFWLVYTYSRAVNVFSVESDGSVTQMLKNGPMLNISDISGTVIRYEQISAWGTHHLLLLGYDTGFLVASICLTPRDAFDEENSTLIDRKSLKFDGPISVLSVLQSDQAKVSVLVSSTLGPATVWSLKKNEGAPLTISWHLVTVLRESELYDTVVAGTVYRSADCASDRADGTVLIGTYGEQLLAYDLSKLLAQQQSGEVGPDLSINIASPILAIQQFGNELLVLSNHGLHRLCPSDGQVSTTAPQCKPYTTTTAEERGET